MESYTDYSPKMRFAWGAPSDGLSQVSAGGRREAGKRRERFREGFQGRLGRIRVCGRGEGS